MNIYPVCWNPINLLRRKRETGDSKRTKNFMVKNKKKEGCDRNIHIKVLFNIHWKLFFLWQYARRKIHLHKPKAKKNIFANSFSVCCPSTIVFRSLRTIWDWSNSNSITVFGFRGPFKWQYWSALKMETKWKILSWKREVQLEIGS